MGRISNGIALAKTSFSVLSENRSLLLFPILSGISLVCVLSTFFGGGYLMFGNYIETALNSETGGDTIGMIVLFFYYLINYFVIIFFNAALIHCAVQTMKGEDTSVHEGLRFAAAKLPQILSWAAVAATVGVIIKTIQERTGVFGNILLGIIGVVWTIATFFVVPVLIYENKDVVASIKRSGEIIKKTWGESLTANFGFGILYFFLILALIPLGFIFFNIMHWAAAIVALVGIFMVASVVLSAAKTVFVAAAYLYANGEPTGAFRADVLDDVFMRK